MEEIEHRHINYQSFCSTIFKNKSEQIDNRKKYLMQASTVAYTKREVRLKQQED